MPAGVDVFIEDGFATIDFVDRSKRGPALAVLLALGGPDLIETMTRTGPRTLFRVPEGNAREAGLLDTPTGGPEVVQAASPRRSTPVRKQVKGTAKHRR